jgi:hypothetical protein
MPVLREGDQEIQIPSTWQVVKLDEHPYYRQASGKYSLKSMDYLILDPTWGVYLVELKDYDDISLNAADKEELATTLDQKAADTKTLIRSIAHMHMRKPYYRWLWAVPLLRSLLPQRSTVWLEAAEMIEAGKCITLYDVRHHG